MDTHPTQPEAPDFRHFGRHTTPCKLNEGQPNGPCNYSRRQMTIETTHPEHATSSVKVQKHHMLPAQATTRYETWKAYSDYVELIQIIYDATAWCSSRVSNMIALPVDLGPAINLELPKHNLHHWDAGGYNDEVTIDIHLRIWLKAKEVKDKKKCPEDVAREILPALAGLENEYRAELKRRGKENGNRSMAKSGQVLSKKGLLDKLREAEAQRKKDPEFTSDQATFAEKLVASEGDLW